MSTWEAANAFIHERADWDRGFISNPFAGDASARLGLERTNAVLHELGDPQRDYHIVHVAGSKGKGSTCSFVDAIVRAAGIRSGRTLSPHIDSWRERFVVNDEPITEDAFGQLIPDVRDAIETVETHQPNLGRTTAFELTTAAALLWFSRAGCEIGIVEVGLGGTLDATNVVTPAVSVITRLDYEHTAILGDTLAEIAANKAGIIKPGVPVIVASQPQDAMTVIEERASELGAPLAVIGREITVAGNEDAFTVAFGGRTNSGLRASMRGVHQVENAALAVAAVSVLSNAETLTQPVQADDIRHGIARAYLPGRFEVLHSQDGHTVVVDGAHTAESMRACVATLEHEFPGAPVTAIVGMLQDKSPQTVLAPIFDVASSIIVTPLASPRALPATDLACAMGPLGPNVVTAASLADAVDRAIAVTPASHGVIVITGSMTLIHESRLLLMLGNAHRP